MSQDLSKPFGPFKRMEPTVFFGSAGAVVAFCVFGGAFTGLASDAFSALQTWIVDVFGWYYVLSATAFLIFAIWLLFSRFGSIRLGEAGKPPAFRTLPWFTMLFAAGMGTGLVFWGVAEPLNHYVNPPSADPRSAAAAREAVQYTFFHWGLHPWAIYLVLALSLAYFHFRAGLPLAPRAVLYPLIGRHIYGPVGHAVDILCTVGTLLGVATSLGLGAMQINAGLNEFLPVPNSTTAQVAIIGAITVVATISVVLGVRHGIRRLSMTNLALAATLLVFVFLAGPTIHILETLVGGLGIYGQTIIRTSLAIDFASRSDWQASWTLFYWGWWISWSPFVGIFIARISEGRTVRELVLAALLVPTLVTFVWLSVFGGSALYLERFADAAFADRVVDNAAISLHAMLGELPLADLSMTLATLVIVIFFITSSDSGSLVDDMVTSGGHPHPPVAQRIFWAVSEGAVAATLLIVGGLSAIQQAAISLGLPMSILLVLACIGMVLAFRAELRTEGPPSRKALRRERKALRQERKRARAR